MSNRRRNYQIDDRWIIFHWKALLNIQIFWDILLFLSFNKRKKGKTVFSKHLWHQVNYSYRVLSAGNIRGYVVQYARFVHIEAPVNGLFLSTPFCIIVYIQNWKFKRFWSQWIQCIQFSMFSIMRIENK